MNAAETIAAAIEKLETLAQHASVAVMFLPIQDDRVEFELGTTLYRTIDAQLALLRRQLDLAGRGHTDKTLDLDLARAILGES